MADRLVRAAPVPLLLIRSSESDASSKLNDRDLFHHILVPLDGSRLAETALDHALAMATLAGARCTLFAAVPPQFDVGGHVFHLGEEEQQRALEKAEIYLKEVARRVSNRGPVIDTRVVIHPHAAPAILEASRELGADLITMATRGRGGVSRLVLGSTADKVLRGADVPLLLHRPA
jgi:nucleotide-binding universal stress UspA family protein